MDPGRPHDRVRRKERPGPARVPPRSRHRRAASGHHRKRASRSRRPSRHVGTSSRTSSSRPPKAGGVCGGARRLRGHRRVSAFGTVRPSWSPDGAFLWVGIGTAPERLDARTLAPSRKLHRRRRPRPAGDRAGRRARRGVCDRTGEERADGPRALSRGQRPRRVALARRAGRGARAGARRGERVRRDVERQGHRAALARAPRRFAAAGRAPRRRAADEGPPHLARRAARRVVERSRRARSGLPDVRPRAGHPGGQVRRRLERLARRGAQRHPGHVVADRHVDARGRPPSLRRRHDWPRTPAVPRRRGPPALGRVAVRGWSVVLVHGARSGGVRGPARRLGAAEAAHRGARHGAAHNRVRSGGRRIYFTAKDKGVGHIMVVPLAGAAPRRALEDGTFAISFSPRGATAAFLAGPSASARRRPS